MGLRHWIYRRTGLKLRRNLGCKPVSPKDIIMADTAFLGANTLFDENCTIADYSYIMGGLLKTTHVGKYCSIALNVTIGADRHPTDWLSTHPFQYNGTDNFEHVKITTIGNDVWIGTNAVILTGVYVGDGAIIGASAVVTKDVPPYAIVAGVPAKIIRYRFNQDIINKLLELKWWDLDHHLLYKDNIDFSNIEKAIEQIEMIKNKAT